MPYGPCSVLMELPQSLYLGFSAVPMMTTGSYTPAREGRVWHQVPPASSGLGILAAATVASAGSLLLSLAQLARLLTALSLPCAVTADFAVMQPELDWAEARVYLHGPWLNVALCHPTAAAMSHDDQVCLQERQAYCNATQLRALSAAAEGVDRATRQCQLQVLTLAYKQGISHRSMPKQTMVEALRPAGARTSSATLRSSSF